MNAKIVQLETARRNRPRDYQRDMMRAAVLQIRALQARIDALEKMIPPPPYCELFGELK
jgi:hypothetical protein